MREVTCKRCGAVYELQWRRAARDGWDALFCLVCDEVICSWSIEGYYVGILKKEPSFRRIVTGDPVS